MANNLPSSGVPQGQPQPPGFTSAGEPFKKAGESKKDKGGGGGGGGRTPEQEFKKQQENIQLLEKRVKKGVASKQDIARFQRTFEGKFGKGSFKEFETQLKTTGKPIKLTQQQQARLSAVTNLKGSALQSFLSKATPQERETVLAGIDGGTLGTKGTIRIGPRGGRILIKQPQRPSKRSLLGVADISVATTPKGIEDLLDSQVTRTQKFKKEIVRRSKEGVVMGEEFFRGQRQKLLKKEAKVKFPISSIVSLLIPKPSNIARIGEFAFGVTREGQELGGKIIKFGKKPPEELRKPLKQTVDFTKQVIIPKVKTTIKQFPSTIKTKFKEEKVKLSQFKATTFQPRELFEKKFLTPEKADVVKSSSIAFLVSQFGQIKQNPEKAFVEAVAFEGGLRVVGRGVRSVAPFVPGFKSFKFQDVPPIVSRSSILSQSKRGVEITHSTPLNIGSLFGKKVDELQIKKLISLEKKAQDAVVLSSLPRAPIPKNPIERTILDSVRGTDTALTGARAQNLQVLPQFTRGTGDFDFSVVSGSTQSSASRTARLLNRRIQQNRFFVKKGGLTEKGKRVFRVVDRKTGKTIADFSPGRGNPTVSVNGLKVISAKHLLKRKSIITQQELQAFRRSKDIGDIERLTGGQVKRTDILKPSSVGRKGFVVSKGLGIRGAGRERLSFSRQVFQKTGRLELGEFGLFFAPKVTRLFLKGQRGGILFVKKGAKITLPTGSIAKRIGRGETGRSLRTSLALKRKPGKILPGQRAVGLGKGEQEFEITEASKIFKQTFFPQFTIDPLTGKFIKVREVGLKKPTTDRNLKSLLKEQKDFLKQTSAEKRLRASLGEITGSTKRSAEASLEKTLDKISKQTKTDKETLRTVAGLRQPIIRKRSTVGTTLSGQSKQSTSFKDTISRRPIRVSTRRTLIPTRGRTRTPTRSLDIIRTPTKRTSTRSPIVRGIGRVTQRPRDPIRTTERVVTRKTPTRITRRIFGRVPRITRTPSRAKPFRDRPVNILKQKRREFTKHQVFKPSLAAVIFKIKASKEFEKTIVASRRFAPTEFRPLTTIDPISRKVLGLDKPSQSRGLF